jgi:hypothetical protein
MVLPDFIPPAGGLTSLFGLPPLFNVQAGTIKKPFIAERLF